VHRYCSWAVGQDERRLGRAVGDSWMNSVRWHVILLRGSFESCDDQVAGWQPRIS
jgi:hypothetical protein